MGRLKLKRLLAILLFASSVFGQGMSTSSVASISNLKNAAYCADTSVSANTITCTTAVGFTGYAPGQSVDILLANTVTGAATINVNTLGAKAVTFNGTNPLTSSLGMLAGSTYRLTYDGTRFVLQGLISAIQSLAFAGLGTPSNGTIEYCTDCTVTSSIDNTCAASGSGAFALRINGAWKCQL